jgi:hypothetical protein
MIEITEMTLAHAYALSRDLREADRLEVEGLGLIPRHSMRKSYYESILKKTVLVDGNVAACFGGSGSILGHILHPWLMTSPRVEKCYFTLAHLYREQVKSMLASYPRLENFCDARYTKSLRLLKIVGFTVEKPEPFGKLGMPFCKFWRNA